MKLELDSFCMGVRDQLEFLKTADLFEQKHTTFFPTIQNQAVWRYAKKGDQLHLHDGHATFTFKVPEAMDGEDFPVERLDDSNKFEFQNGSHEKGTAQVHRADPGSIYLTLQDGRNNPTFTLQHQSGTSWKGIPKKRLKKMLPEATETIDVDPASVIAGAKKTAELFWANR